MNKRIPFQLIKPIDLNILRFGDGVRIKGRYHQGNTTTVPIKALITPVIKQSTRMLLPESVRDKDALRLFSNDLLQMFDGKRHEQSDEFIYNNSRYRICKLGDWVSVSGFTGYEAYAYKIDVLNQELP